MTRHPQQPLANRRQPPRPLPPPEPPSLDAQVNDLARTYFSALHAEEGMQEKIQKSIMDEVVTQHNKQTRQIVQNVYQQIFALGSAAYTTYWPRAQTLGKTDLYNWINEALSFWQEWSTNIDDLKAQLAAYREMRAYVAMVFASNADLHHSAIAYFMLPEHFQES